MRNIRRLLLICCMPWLFFSACDVHEWPEIPELVTCNLSLAYNTEMTEWGHLYDDTKVVEQGFGTTYNNHREQGVIRYIVRTYPLTENQRALQSHAQEFVFTKDISQGYDHEVTLELLPGDYTLMVWSDLVESDEEAHFYDADNFVEIKLQDKRHKSSDYRDAFCGQSNISLPRNGAKLTEHTINVRMRRPMAKFEFVANDLLEFVAAKGSNLDQYKAKILYVGYVPHTYGLFAGRPVASTMGVVVESSLTKLTESKVSMGFDYVFVSDNGSKVTVRIGIYDKNDKQVSLSDPITLPVKPDHHTVLEGKFLMLNASNGVYIDPNWGGDFNLTL